MQRLLLSAREAAFQLGGVSLRHLWALTAPRGPIPCVKLGRRVFYRPADLEEFARQAARRQAAAATPQADAEGAADGR